jgi:Tfp pilus assembly protein PilN
MPELEFLPTWYSRLRRQRRIVALQCWLAAMIATALLSWQAFAQASVQQRWVQRDNVQRQLSASIGEVRELSGLLEARTKLKRQQQIAARLGPSVEITRLLAELDRLLPREIALQSVFTSTVEQARPSEGKDTQAQAIDRSLKVRMIGVAPSDVDVSNLVSRLQGVPFFQQVTPVPSRDRSEAGRLEREFDITFYMSLNWPAGK